MSLQVTSRPASNSAYDRVSQANTMRELPELIPIGVRPRLGEVCDKAFRLSQKASTILVALDELKAHKEGKSLPRTIAARPYKVETTK